MSDDIAFHDAHNTFDNQCCWPQCTKTRMPQTVVYEWPLCFTHTAEATEYVHRTELGLTAGDAVPPQADAQRRAKAARTQARNRQRATNAGWVYYIRVGNNIKIGYAGDVRKRMLGYPPDSTLLAVEPGDKKLERERHKEFAHSLQFGREWFRESYPIKKHIAEIRDKHGTALADLQHPTKRRNNTPIGPRSSNNGWSKPA